MNIQTYFAQARSVAIYPVAAQFYYPVLGLVGEFGELTGKMDAGGKATDIPAFTKELGDCLWYITNTTLDLGREAHDLIGRLVPDTPVATFEELATAVMAKPPTGAENVMTHLGIIAEIAKKTIRDNNCVISHEKKEKVMQSLMALMAMIVYLCNHNSIPLADVATGNIEKLFSRRDRGVLSGSGDNR